MLVLSVNKISMLYLLLFICFIVVNCQLDYILKERIIKRVLLNQINPTDQTKQHEIVISIKQNNIDTLKSLLDDISHPKSPNYQKWLTFDEVGELIANPNAFNKVISWLDSIEGSIITFISPRKEYIKVTNTISTWEKVLLCKYYDWMDLSQDKIYTIADEYSIPNDLNDSIEWVFNTVQTPPLFHRKYQRKADSSVYKTNLRYSSDGLSVYSDAVTVSFLNDYYDITSNEGNKSLSQSVFETSGESYSPDDLTTFQETFSLPIESAVDYNGYNTTDCFSTDGDCYEGNLDIQYISGVSQYTTSIYWYVGGDNPYLTWLIDMSAQSNPPQVNSMSWGSLESETSESTLEQFNTEAMKLGAIGVTITISSGDDGAPNTGDLGNCLCNKYSGSSSLAWPVTGSSWSGYGYFPSFPATSPYVTAVGATMGPNTGDEEITCMSNYGGVITSGGGFSQYYDRPSWQDDAVSSYFDNLQSQPTSGYNPNGRGYPDVSLIGVEYAVVVEGSITYLYGTSCSSPTFAAMISLLNAARSRDGQPTLGYLNPTLYYGGPNGTYFNDVTSGANRCCSNNEYPIVPTTCCLSGFNASVGWDPTSGWGSIDYTNLAELLSTVVPASSDSNSSTTLTLGDIIGIVFAVLFFIALIFTIYRFFSCIGRCVYRLGRRKEVNENDTPTVTTAELSTSFPPIVQAHAIAVGVPSSDIRNPMVL